MRARHTAVIALLAASAVLSGCTTLGIPDYVARSASPSAEPVPSPAGPVSVSRILDPPADGAIVATGTLVGNPGTISIVRDGSDWALSVTGAGTPPSDLVASLSSTIPASVEDCHGGDLVILAESSRISGDEARFPLRLGRWNPGAQEDPRFLQSAILERRGNGCVAYAVIEWTLSPSRPDLVAVDSGPQPGARGQVEGSSYRIERGDAWGAIASRFGITSDDLAYLNPVTSWSVEVHRNEIQAECTLNLSPLGRSNAPRCAWTG